MEGKTETFVVGALKELVARAIMLGMSCSEKDMQGSILEMQNADIVEKMILLHESTGDFLAAAGIAKTADEILPLLKEITFQLPMERL
ncbi:hypothetical protein [Serratia fonticola]|uniref:hypothetical protein n=1 Tax=Serratia fonticola TaxID=47917 RepID=UPI002DB7A358|nr:hypothetical protein [Serratia fonticola]MEB7885626.1 hypothetical protein [Serratia fonticola]